LYNNLNYTTQKKQAELQYDNKIVGEFQSSTPILSRFNNFIE